ncbi:MAG: hypothetical protein AABW63_03775 [Nanoarchaeota archaeon]
MLKKNKRLSLVLAQIVILVLGTIAISYALGSEVRAVSALEQKSNSNPAANVEGVTIGAGAAATAVIPSSAGKGTVSKVAATGFKKFIGNAFGPINGGFNGFVAAVGYAAVLGTIAGLTAKLFGASSAEASAIGKGVGFGYLGFKLTLTFVKFIGVAGPAAPIIAVFVGVGILFGFLFGTKDYKQETVVFQCLPWQPQAGGDDCSKCNTQILPCSEYQCKSLGASCELINKGTSEQKCFASKANDVAAPVITPATEFLSDKFVYTPDGTISPPDRGVIVQNTAPSSKCVKAFQPFTFGFRTDEFAQCKVDTVRKKSFDDMTTFFGGSNYYTINHTQTISLPSKESLEVENLTLQNGGQFSLYVRCRDTSPNKNTNTADFVFKYCVESVDNEAPVVMATNILNGNPVAFNQSSVEVNFYINEPAECRWTHDADKSFDNMEGTMSCSQRVTEFNVQNVYPCKTTLTGIKDSQENKFYIKCKDKPFTTENRKTMAQGYPFTLIGTKPLVISDVKPNETVRDSTEAIKVTLRVETTAGYKDGEATCFYSETENERDYNQFYNTGGNTHSQDLWLPTGSYKYFIKCVDLGGNIDTNYAEFDVESDNQAPLVVRAYHEDDLLKLITNEEGKCVYSTSDCTYIFSDGQILNNFEKKEFSIDWDPKRTYYVKCEDQYGNQPAPNMCSIIVRPLN